VPAGTRTAILASPQRISRFGAEQTAAFLWIQPCEVSDRKIGSLEILGISEALFANHILGAQVALAVWQPNRKGRCRPSRCHRPAARPQKLRTEWLFCPDSGRDDHAAALVILALALGGAVQVCHDQRILLEYAEVLARPRFKLDPERGQEVLTKLKADGLAVDASKQLNLELPDPDDETFLGVALAGSVDFLVTGNLADYPMEKRRGCAVVSPSEFMEHWRKLKRGA